MSSLSGKIKSLNYKMSVLATLTDASLPDLYQKVQDGPLVREYDLNKLGVWYGLGSDKLL